jgi:tetratricopeptide (TPR) repeat protein
MLPVICLLAAVSAIGQQEPPQANRGVISLKNRTWGIVLELPGYEVKVSETKPNGRRYMLADKISQGLVVSIFLEEVFPGEPIQSCRATLEQRAKGTEFEKKDVRISASGDKTILEYMIPKVIDVPVQQKNLFVCMFRDNVFIDLHFSKTGFKPGDEKLFQPVLDSLTYQDNIQRSSRDFMEVASLYYFRRELKKSIPSYEKALALEKEHPALEKKLWYVLIDNLGMAYGITGNLPSAKETFEYGISKDPEYPLFYYNMACTYAEMNNLELAMDFLKKAFDRKANVIPGEKMPDPRTDDSFKRYMKNKDFRKLADALMAS